ncbi:MAG: CBS domain-containing protein [Candidatus Neomarinimicrobiota bacterium]
MRLVSDILSSKGHDVYSVKPDTSVFDALKLMAEKNIGAVMVLRGQELVGIFSERDYARKVILKGKSSADTPVSDIMTSKVAYIGPHNTLEECMALMTDKHFRHLPVMEANRLLGLISIGDVVKAIISNQQIEIKQLESYITGLLHGV